MTRYIIICECLHEVDITNGKGVCWKCNNIFTEDTDGNLLMIEGN